MLTKIIMPSGGQTTYESLLDKWRKKIGDPVKRGDVLFEIETDKANLEVESYGEGTLLATYFNEGDYVTAGEIVAYIGNEGDQLPEAVKADSSKGTMIPGSQNSPISPKSQSNPANLEIREEDEYQPIMKKAAVYPDMKSKVLSYPQHDTSKVLASPAARFLARSEKIEIEEIARSIPGQVIKRNDVVNFLKKTDIVQEEDYYYLNATSMRKVIARRMVKSTSTAPHFTVSMEIDMTQIIELRQLLNEYLETDGIKVSFNDIIMKCVSAVIAKYPLINGVYNEDRIKVFNDVNFGLAVGLENGLVVPVARKTNRKSLAEIAKENTENIQNAKKGKLQSSDMTGGTITLSNLGIYGVDSFTAIINQPESCILAAGQVAEKAVSINGQILSRQMMTLTASFDHRLIDGAYGAAFLKQVKRLLENPRLLLA